MVKYFSKHPTVNKHLVEKTYVIKKLISWNYFLQQHEISYLGLITTNFFLATNSFTVKNMQLIFLLKKVLVCRKDKWNLALLRSLKIKKLKRIIGGPPKFNRSTYDSLFIIPQLVINQTSAFQCQPQTPLYREATIFLKIG